MKNEDVYDEPDKFRDRRRQDDPRLGSACPLVPLATGRHHPSGILSSEEDSALAPWHQPAGWIAAFLIVFRPVWGFAGGEHARFANFLKPRQIIPHLRHFLAGRPERSVGHNALGGLAVLTLLGAIGAIVYTGAIMQGDGG